MKKILWLLCTAALLLAGCGKNDTTVLSSDDSAAAVPQAIVGEVQAIQGEEVTLCLGRLSQDEKTFSAGKDTQTVRILSNLAIEMPDGTEGILSDLVLGDVLEVGFGQEGQVKSVICRISPQNQSEQGTA